MICMIQHAAGTAPEVGNVLLRHLFISPEHNFFGHHGQSPGTKPMLEVCNIECVTGRGIRGDRFFDYKENYKGQITFFAMETYSLLCEWLRVFDKAPSVFRRNVMTEGMALREFIGEEFEIQGIRFRGVEECKPCYWMDQAFAPGAERVLRGQGGLRAIILSDGMLYTNLEFAAK
jgi:MOSC domain-containing protein YiiM